MPPSRRSRPLSWALCPSSTYRARGSTSRGFASPATVRLQGLATLLTVYSPRARAGLVSCRQRSWDFALRSFPLPKGIPGVSARDEPTCRFNRRCAFGRTLRPDRRPAAPGLGPLRKSLAALHAVNASAAGCSLGLSSLPGPPTGRLACASAPAPLTCLVAAAALTAPAPAPQSITRHPTRPTPSPGPAKRAGRTALLGFSHRFGPGVQGGGDPGYGFTSQTDPRYQGPSTALWVTCPTLPEPTGPKCGAKQTQPLGHG